MCSEDRIKCEVCQYGRLIIIGILGIFTALCRNDASLWP